MLSLHVFNIFIPRYPNQMSLISNDTADVDCTAVLVIHHNNEASLCQPFSWQQYFCTISHFCHQHFLKKTQGY